MSAFLTENPNKPSSGPYYAWTVIHVTPGTTIKPGDEVTSDELPEGDFALFISERVLRLDPFPENVHPGEAVRTYMVRVANEQYAAAVAVPEAQAVSAPGETTT